MTKNSGLASSQTLILGAAGLVVAALAAAYGLGLFDSEDQAEAPVQPVSEPAAQQPVETATEAAEQPAPVTEPATEAQAPAEEVAEPAEAAPEAAPVAAAAPEAAPEPEAAPLPAAPSFDVVRVESDGNTLVAGTANGELVEILLDRGVIASAEPGSDGKFTAFLSLDPSEAPRLMSLLLHAGEARVASEDQVIIAPVKPVVVAAAEPQVEQAATPVAETAPAETADAAPVSEAASADSAADTPAKEPVETATATVTEEAPQPVETATETATNDSAVEPAVEQEPAAPAVLLAGKDGVSVIQPAQTGTAPFDLVLDAISYGDGGAVELTGRGAGGANIRTYLNNSARATAAIGEAGLWTTRLTDVEPGIYTLRIDQIDAAGKVTARIETPFKREAPEKVAAAEAAQAQQAGADQAGAAAPIRVVTIQPGNTLWAIAREQYGEGLLYVRLFEANRDLIRDPDLIYPGQVFEIPRD
ncbi:LysM peptidoglycan-binding domain-containing protein [Thalassovita mangrovi]|uniref:LysM peptidoglycan-binding domain-containing protein n=1 Tax=Thalassovita mangrovi TaxID=2692236 RepID=A0A6L8LDT6_9RHOB|nr:LysM peptidoglycan-binding domain-containing protein [Thalassovita mangrovi]MYM54221.1 LysM peptidoglycan-binding domain-containing protein [Thalassovita mangrovi]